MMKKFISFVIAAVAAFTFTAAAGCNGGGKKLKEVNAEIWTMPSTVKVLRDEDYSEYFTETPALEISLAKNEYEGVQLMITPEEDVDYFYASVGALTDGKGNALSGTEVYAEHYVNVRATTAPNSLRPKGYYPDALIPMDIFAENGENKIGAGQNQGIYINVHTEEDTPAGVYTGNVKLTVNSKEHTVPVSVKVWDFTVPTETHGRSTFNLMQDYIIGCQLDNTPEIYKKAVDYLLDYRITTTEMASWDYTDEDWIKTIKEYAADPRVTSYNVHGDGTHGLTLLKLCIENSTPELNLVEKAFIYLLDEPFPMLEEATARQKNKIDELIALANSYTDAELKTYGLTREDIMGVEVLITMTASIATIDGLRTYAPLVSDLNTPAQREMYAGFRRDAYKGKNNELAGKDCGVGTTWWYVCVHPYEPYVNFNIDMDLNSNRALLWMQYDYDIEGLLYWDTAMYVGNESSIDTINGPVSADVYNKTNGTYPSANGDGYLIYPGAKYGLDEFFPSIRLMTIRDGFEDYEYLYMLENKYNAALAEYGITDMSFDAAMRSIYDSMYTGTVANTDFNAVLRSREKVAHMIELLDSDAKAFYSIGNIDAIDNDVNITVVAKAGSTLKVGDKTLTGQSYGNAVKFVYNLKLGSGDNYFDATLTSGTAVIPLNIFVSGGVKNISSFEQKSEISKVKVSQRLGTPKDHITAAFNTDAEFVSNGTGSLKIDIAACEWTMAEEARYKPYFYIEKGLIGDVKNIKTFELDIYNDSGRTLNLSIELQAQSGSGASRSKRVLQTQLLVGWNKIKIDNPTESSWILNGEDLYEKVKSLNFCFDLPAEDVTVYVDNVYITEK